MKILLTIFGLSLVSIAAQAQENSLALYGGYSFGTGSVGGTQPTGWKINASYEFVSFGEHWSLGGDLGYISLSGTASSIVTSSTFKLQAVPITLVPRFSFGGDKFNGYVRGIIGSHVSTITYSGTLIGSNDTQWGMSFGLGVGAKYFMNDRLFIGVDYEWLRLSNALEDSGAINSATVGIGMKF